MLLLRQILHAYVESGPKGVWTASRRKAEQILGRSNGNPAVGSGPAPPADAATLRDGAAPGPHPFDLMHGTETSGLIGGQELSSGRWNDLWNTAYYGISPSGLTQMLEALDLDWPRFTFVDLGSGKGRALLLASRFPFRQIVGVEISPELSDMAATNVERFSTPWQTCHEIEARVGDAAEFIYPAGRLVVFLYQPFLSPVLKKCLKNLARSLDAEPREVYVMYVNPVYERLLNAVPRLERYWERSFAFSEEDLRADRLGATGDRVVVYRFMP
jgi:SAM-dependent methyltransferase